MLLFARDSFSLSFFSPAAPTLFLLCAAQLQYADRQAAAATAATTATAVV